MDNLSVYLVFVLIYVDSLFVGSDGCVSVGESALLIGTQWVDCTTVTAQGAGALTVGVGPSNTAGEWKECACSY